MKSSEAKTGNAICEGRHTSEGGGVGEEAVAQADAQIPEYSGVCEVPLPSRDGQLCRQVPHDRIRHPNIPLAVLKINGVHLHQNRALTQLFMVLVTCSLSTLALPLHYPHHVPH